MENQKMRFIATGAINTTLDFIFVNILVLSFHSPAIIANTISLSACMIFSYFMNHFFVFRSQQPVTIKSIAVFVSTTGLTLLVIQNIILVGILTLFSSNMLPLLSIGGLDASVVELNLAKIIAVIFSMVINFGVYKYVIFKHNDSTVESKPHTATK